MFDDKKVEYIKAITPVHAGTGQDLGIVDMPIQREIHTFFPKIEGSSLKGAIKFHVYNKIRDYNKEVENDRKDNKKFNQFYEMLGYEGDDKDSDNNAKEKGASRLAFTDAKLLFFPVKGVERLFYYVTCPYILKRWHEEVYSKEIDIPNLDEGRCIVLAKEESDDNNRIILEEYIFEKQSDLKINDVIRENSLKKVLSKDNTIIVSDSDFEDLVTMYTEMITRNKINPETGVAENTGLFTEEYLPSESIMYYMVLGSPKFKACNEKNTEKEPLEYYEEKIGDVFQIGGNKTIGKGIVKRLSVDEGSSGNNE